jgi:hypothetical protein
MIRKSFCILICFILINYSAIAQSNNITNKSINISNKVFSTMPKKKFDYDIVSQGTPPDPNIAVSERVVVATMNHQLAVYSKQNPGTLLYEEDFTTLIGAANLPFDARITYDYDNKRFIVVTAVSGNAINTSYLGVIVSRHNNPTNLSDWCSFKMFPNLLKDKITFVDSPGISVSAGGKNLFLSANTYNVPNPQEPNTRVALGGLIAKINLDQLYTCEPGFTFKEVSGLKTPGTNELAESFRPVEWALGSYSEKAYFVNHHLLGDPGVSKTYVWSMDNNYASNNFPNVTTIEEAFRKSPGLRQPTGATLSIASSPWYIQALYKDGIIWATHDVSSSNSASSRVSLNKIDLATGSIDYFRETNNIDYAYQSFMLDSFNNVAVVFNYSNLVDSPPKSAAIVFSGLTSSIELVRNSDGIINNGNSGDYSGAALDPNGKDLWFMHIYIGSDSKWHNTVICLTFFTNLYIPYISR